MDEGAMPTAPPIYDGGYGEAQGSPLLPVFPLRLLQPCLPGDLASPGICRLWDHNAGDFRASFRVHAWAVAWILGNRQMDRFRIKSFPDFSNILLWTGGGDYR